MSTRQKLIIIQCIVLFAMINFLYAGKKQCITNMTTSPYAKLRSIGIDEVIWTKGFWADKFKLMCEVGVPNMWQVLSDPEVGHAWQNFRIAAGLQEGEFRGTWWHDGDFYKWLEASCYIYAKTKDKKLDKLIDEVIKVIGKAQQEDGYLSTPIIIGHGSNPPKKPFKGKTKRFAERVHHELYNMGHLITVGCIHYRITGKRSLLKIAQKTADYLYPIFINPDNNPLHLPLNPSIIMALVELYRTTGDSKYLELANAFVTQRGTLKIGYQDPKPWGHIKIGSDYNQDRVPLREETKAVGHAVMANYLYAGAADVYLETGEESLLQSLERIWKNIVYQKMYITGGTGSGAGLSARGDRVGEAYLGDYYLPNNTAYNETCANIGNAMFNWRMLLISGESRFMDIVELVLYNSALSGISIDGKHFYYKNPLGRSQGDHKLKEPERRTYIPCFCCPPNIVRTIAKIDGWAYSTSNNAVWVHLYGGNKLETEFPDGAKLELTQDTNYPWDGKIKIEINEPKKKQFAVMLRIPSWAEGTTLTVNGKPVSAFVKSGMYMRIFRTWEAGDIINLDIPMPVQMIEAHPEVGADRGRIAIKRGPIVYCLESPELPEDVRVKDVLIPANIQLAPNYEKDFLGGVTVLEGTALIKNPYEELQAIIDKAEAIKDKDNWTNTLYRPIKQPIELRDLTKRQSIGIRLIPYYAWSNRGLTDMAVWMPLVGSH